MREGGTRLFKGPIPSTQHTTGRHHNNLGCANSGVNDTVIQCSMNFRWPSIYTLNVTCTCHFIPKVSNVEEKKPYVILVDGVHKCNLRLLMGGFCSPHCSSWASYVPIFTLFYVCLFSCFYYKFAPKRLKTTLGEGLQEINIKNENNWRGAESRNWFLLKQSRL